MSRSISHSEGGYTIIELIVSTQILMLILLFSYQAFSFMIKTIRDSEADANLLEAEILLRNIISATSKTCPVIRYIGKDRMVFSRAFQEEMPLYLEENRLYWRNQSLLPGDVRVLRMEFIFHSDRHTGLPDHFHKADRNGDRCVDIMEYCHYEFIELQVRLCRGKKSTDVSCYVVIPERLKHRYQQGQNAADTIRKHTRP